MTVPPPPRRGPPPAARPWFHAAASDSSRGIRLPTCRRCVLRGEQGTDLPEQRIRLVGRTAISEGRYRLNHIIAADPSNRSITLSQPLNPGERLFWAMRDALASERDMRAAIERGGTELGESPDFALMFPCMGRGPLFYGNRDRDLELLRSRFPGMPFIGFYGNGEIGPLEGGNHLHQYSTVLGLFHIRPPRA